MVDEKEEKFSVYAVRKNEPTVLIQTDLSFGRLMDDIIVPFQANETFFIDGAPVRATDLDRIKIVQQGASFENFLKTFHRDLRFSGNLKKQELYGKQYHVRLEAILREGGVDVTSQIIKAYDTVIKPKLRDYLPNKEALLHAAVQVFADSIKLLQ